MASIEKIAMLFDVRREVERVLAHEALGELGVALFQCLDDPHDIPCGPILSMKEIAEEPSLRKTGTVVEVDHPTRGKYLSVGNPIKMSDSPTEVKRSPLLGEHTDEVLTELGYNVDQVAALRAAKVI